MMPAMNGVTFALAALLVAVPSLAIKLTVNGDVNSCGLVPLSWDGQRPWIIQTFYSRYNQDPAYMSSTPNMSSIYTSYTWVVKVKAGSYMRFKVTDATGASDISEAYTVGDGVANCDDRDFETDSSVPTSTAAPSSQTANSPSPTSSTASPGTTRQPSTGATPVSMSPTECPPPPTDLPPGSVPPPPGCIPPSKPDGGPPDLPTVTVTVGGSGAAANASDTAAAAASSSSKKSNNAGAIAGGVVGGVVALLALLLLLLCCRRRRKRDKESRWNNEDKVPFGVHEPRHSGSGTGSGPESNGSDSDRWVPPATYPYGFRTPRSSGGSPGAHLTAAGGSSTNIPASAQPDVLTNRFPVPPPRTSAPTSPSASVGSTSALPAPLPVPNSSPGQSSSQTKAHSRLSYASRTSPSLVSSSEMHPVGRTSVDIGPFSHSMLDPNAFEEDEEQPFGGLRPPRRSPKIRPLPES